MPTSSGYHRTPSRNRSSGRTASARSTRPVHRRPAGSRSGCPPPAVARSRRRSARRVRTRAGTPPDTSGGQGGGRIAGRDRSACDGVRRGRGAARCGAAVVGCGSSQRGCLRRRRLQRMTSWRRSWTSLPSCCRWSWSWSSRPAPRSRSMRRCPGEARGAGPR